MQTLPKPLNSELRKNLLLVKKNLLEVISSQVPNNILKNATSIIDSINVMIAKNEISAKYHSMLAYTDSYYNLFLATTNRGKVTEVNNYFSYNKIGSAVTQLFVVSYPDVGVDVEETKYSFAQNATTKSLAYSVREDLDHALILADDSGININLFTETITAIKEAYDEHPMSNLDNIEILADNLRGLSETDYDIIPFLPGVVSARFSRVTDYVIPLLGLQTVDPQAIWDNNVRDEVANNILVLDSIAEINAETAEFGDDIPVRAAMHSAISIARKGVELAKGSGTMQGVIKDPVDSSVNSTEILSEFGYNPIFFLEDKQQFLGDVHPRVRAQFDHRSEAISSALAELFYNMAFDHS